MNQVDEAKTPRDGEAESERQFVVCGVANPGGIPCTKKKGHPAGHDKGSYGPSSERAAEAADLVVDALRTRVEWLEVEIDAFWTALHRSWQIEPREYFEMEASKNGFDYPLAMAVHYLWKREVKDQEGVQQMKAAVVAKVREVANGWEARGASDVVNPERAMNFVLMVAAANSIIADLEKVELPEDTSTTQD